MKNYWEIMIKKNRQFEKICKNTENIKKNLSKKKNTEKC